MCQDVPSPLAIHIGNEVREVTDHFTYLGSTTTCSLFLDAELDKQITKAAVIVAQLSKRLSTTNSQHQVAGQGHQFCNASKSKLPQHAFHAHPAMFAIVGSHKTDACKEDMESTDINSNTWELLADNRSGWRYAGGSQESTYGYPDPDYLSNVTRELADREVTEVSMSEDEKKDASSVYERIKRYGCFLDF
ncbi:hypothetical protein RRG08_042092 [Elysia crispata]|uniref:Uncharacterized protein n=1 Tax=Elysia crispata TaxID=231223 RepID=A0AAE0YG01_9GAST|nr:hypothetical protein RRG08_042092 [Elysia crispata]